MFYPQKFRLSPNSHCVLGRLRHDQGCTYFCLVTPQSWDLRLCIEDAVYNYSHYIGRFLLHRWNCVSFLQIPSACCGDGHIPRGALTFAISCSKEEIRDFRQRKPFITVITSACCCSQRWKDLLNVKSSTKCRSVCVSASKTRRVNLLNTWESQNVHEKNKHPSGYLDFVWVFFGGVKNSTFSDFVQFHTVCWGDGDINRGALSFVPQLHIIRKPLLALCLGCLLYVAASGSSLWDTHMCFCAVTLMEFSALDSTLSHRLSPRSTPQSFSRSAELRWAARCHCLGRSPALCCSSSLEPRRREKHPDIHSPPASKHTHTHTITA